MPVITRKTLAMEIEILESCSLAADTSTGAFASGELIATVEIDWHMPCGTASWWVSGPNEKGALSMLFQAQLPIAATTKSELDTELLNFASQYAFPLAERIARSTPGLNEYFEGRSPEQKSSLFLRHLVYRFTDHFRSNLTPVKQTIQQFQLATSLGLGTQVRDIAKFQKISPLTIETRITRARKSGQLPKATLSLASDIKDHN